MSKNACASDEGEAIRKSIAPTVIMTGNETAELAEEATVHVNDLDVCVTVMLLEDSLALLSLGLWCEEMGCSHDWKKGDSPSSNKDGIFYEVQV